MFGSEINYLDSFITFIFAFIITFSATPIAKKIALKYKAVDYPKDARRMHKRPIARMGGIAIIAGFVVSVLFMIFSGLALNGSKSEIYLQLLGIMAGILILAVIGITDDIKKLSPLPKFIAQVAAALCVVVISNMRITILTNPFSSATAYIVLPDYISYPLTVLWIVGITNAINLIDGLDGLAAGITPFPVSRSFINLYTNQGLSVMTLVSVLILARPASMEAFCRIIFIPRRLLWVTRAHIFGFILGNIDTGAPSIYVISISIPLLVLGLPVFDTLSSIIRRIRNRKRVTEADRGHIHHRLIDMGLSQRQTVIIMYVASAGLGLGAIVLAEKGPLSAVVLVVLTAVL